MSIFYPRARQTSGRPRHGGDTLDGSAPYYRVYDTSDGRFLAVGAVEEVFFSELLRRLGVDPERFGDRRDRSQWPRQSRMLADIFATGIETIGRPGWKADVASALSLTQPRPLSSGPVTLAMCTRARNSVTCPSRVRRHPPPRPRPSPSLEEWVARWSGPAEGAASGRDGVS